MSNTHAIFDASQHCTATKTSNGKNVAMDCPYTGKGEEFSPTSHVEAALSVEVFIVREYRTCADGRVEAFTVKP